MLNHFSSPEFRTRSILGFIFLYLLLVLPFVIWPIDPQPDERRYSIAAVQMMASGDFVLPVSETGDLRLTKPPLTYYYVVAGFSLLGETLLGAKLFFLLSAIAIVMLVFALAWALGASDTGSLLAVSMMVGHRLFFTTSTQYIPDIPLVLGTTCALLGFVHVLRGTARPIHLYLAWVGVAWAILAKGFIALVLVAIYLAVRMGGRVAELPIQLRRHERLAVIIAFAVTVPWFAHVALFHWDTLVAQFFGDQVANKVKATPASVLAGLMKTSTGLFLYAAPGLLALTLARRSAGRLVSAGLSNPAVHFLIAWIVFNLVIFSVSRQIYGRYTLPAAPALMALAGLYATALPWDALSHGMRRAVRILVPTAAAILLAAGALGIIFGAEALGIAAIVAAVAGASLLWRFSATRPVMAGLLAIALFFPTFEVARLPIFMAVFMPTDGKIAARRIDTLDPQARVLIVNRGAQLVDRIGVERGNFGNLDFARRLPDTLDAEMVIFTDPTLQPVLEAAGYRLESDRVVMSIDAGLEELWSLILMRDATLIRQNYGAMLYFATRR